MYLSENDTVHGDRQGAQIEIDTPLTDEVEPSAIPALADASSLTDKPIPPTVTPSKLPLEPGSVNAHSKICTIPEQQHLRILDEAFGNDLHHALHNHVLCTKNGCKSLSSIEISRQLPSKPHVFKHEWIDDDTVFCRKSGASICSILFHCQTRNFQHEGLATNRISNSVWDTGYEVFHSSI